MSEKPARKFAVVQWSEGDDSGKLSYVKTNAIIGYDDTRMGPDGLPLRPYQASIEWQRGKRPPGGYPYYAANVMFVTGKIQPSISLISLNACYFLNIPE